MRKMTYEDKASYDSRHPVLDCGVISRIVSLGTHRNESCCTWERVMSHIEQSPVTRRNESCHRQERVMSHVEMSYVGRRNESCHA